MDEIVKTIVLTKRWQIKSMSYPYSERNKIIAIRMERNCIFCSKYYLKCDFFGIVFTDKGSKICCDDCCKNIESQGLKNEYAQKQLWLIGCEESQTITIELRKLGIEAYSCDLQKCSGGHPEWHLQMDVFEAIKLKKWTHAVFHPPCPKLSKAGARWLYAGGSINEERLAQGMEAKDFFMKLWNCEIENIAIENPTPLKIFQLPLPTQIIQPYQFGDPFSKKTLLWIKGFPELKHTNVLTEYTPYMPSNTGGRKRGQKATPKNITKKASSKTFIGIAKAIAHQWTNQK